VNNSLNFVVKSSPSPCAGFFFLLYFASMKKIAAALLFTAFALAGHAQIKTLFETSNGTQTPTYGEIIKWWQQMDKVSPYVQMQPMGMTDAGFPLHLVLISTDKDFNIASLKKKNKRILLVNNGIHPGEPDGIDASMLLARNIDYTIKRFTGLRPDAAVEIPAGIFTRLPQNVVLAIIPVYNIGGCLNRSADFRVDQNGPEEFGFRGNSQNLDLNRDFIKCDSKDARALTEIFHYLDPDVFIDNHVSNGADYQHIMTLLTTQHNKLGGAMGEFLNKEFEPGLYKNMKEKGYDLIPYVNVWGDTPDKGWPEYWDSPRYTSGFAALWHTFSFVPETHMLKSYEQRVIATKALMESFIAFTSANSEKIKNLREQTKAAVKTQSEFPISWALDRSWSQEFLFKGYESGYKPSEVSGLPRLYYDRSKPYEKMVKLFNYFPAKTIVQKPKAYIIPQGWWKVIELLKLNKVQMRAFTKDTTVEVEVYKVTDYKTSPRQYEMHHLNSDVKLVTATEKIKCRKGDWYIPMNQVANRFLMETLEPQAEDSYFAWNYFDAILGQKEGYSAYAFEDIAAGYLKSNPAIKTKLEQRKATDTAFAKDARAQLNFVYQNSPWHEPAYMRYPVYRVK
jgi:Zinc carboxypeptidase